MPLLQHQLAADTPRTYRLSLVYAHVPSEATGRLEAAVDVTTSGSGQVDVHARLLTREGSVPDALAQAILSPASRALDCSGQDSLNRPALPYFPVLLHEEIEVGDQWTIEEQGPEQGMVEVLYTCTGWSPTTSIAELESQKSHQDPSGAMTEISTSYRFSEAEGCVLAAESLLVFHAGETTETMALEVVLETG